MKYRLIVALFYAIVVASVNICAETVNFSGYEGKAPIAIVPSKDTGLNMLYVVNSTSGLTMTISCESRPEIYRYSSLGGGYAEPISGYTYSDGIVTMENPEGDMGYIVELGEHRFYFWITDYSRHRFSISSISIPEEQDCVSCLLNVAGEASPIYYYGINGRSFELSREIELRYHTLEWNAESVSYDFVEKTVMLEDFTSTVSITPPPYCNTNFTISGDRFLKAWGEIQELESREFVTHAVDAETEVEQLNSPESDKSNMISSSDDSGLGGSAPALIRFTAYTTDALIHDEWQIARDSEFEYIDNRFNEREVEYEFRDEGTFYIRFVGSNADGTCSVYSETYTVGIGASELICPNAFSPGTTEGVNDEWKVSYRSLVEFKCWIFDRYGNQMCHFEDPQLGWDGKYHGKLVKPGVYFYVIEATGADGKKYKKSGDINILNYKTTGYSQEAP